MIVKAVVSRSAQVRNPGETPEDGQNYLVISVIFSKKNIEKICVVENNAIVKEKFESYYPVLYHMEYFVIIDNHVPDDWTFTETDSAYWMEPKAFQKENFWSEFHDGNRDAEIIFEEEYNKIAKFHGWESKNFVF